ncbi:endonuclease/exonuclease/phosphatase family protein [Streptomyces sp. NRRL S-1868]|uniref:endonuclease/exonuclease/phosphatase family protein n=1 Tax=Streptomyces sp. NRRL S-1868 TaxID=1463892 RepID=UPI0004C4B015|nr:endonuclease/exonuclease/phosphatase family protein [Streptomyces sp. NRRL S-1868]
MLLTITVQNLGHGGLADGDGNPEDRWPQLAERINGAAERVGAPHVDVAMFCEANGWERYGHKQLARAARDLSLDAAPLTPSRSGYGTALLYRREVLGHWVRHNADFGREALHGLAVTAVDIGLPAPLSFLPVHFTPFSAEQAVIEANYAATRGYKYGPFAVLAGDVNYPPASAAHPLPDFGEMRPYNIGSRTLLPDGDFAPGQALEPDRRVTRKLAHNGLVDVAWHLFQQSGDEALLRPTATDDRIDQIWVSGPLADAVSDYQVLDTPAGASDHHGLVVRLDTDAIDTTNLWTYR